MPVTLCPPCTAMRGKGCCGRCTLHRIQKLSVGTMSLPAYVHSHSHATLCPSGLVLSISLHVCMPHGHALTGRPHGSSYRYRVSTAVVCRACMWVMHVGNEIVASPTSHESVQVRSCALSDARDLRPRPLCMWPHVSSTGQCVQRPRVRAVTVRTTTRLLPRLLCCVATAVAHDS
mgnify:CR=1 FL=1